jgi:hypothetical protein
MRAACFLMVVLAASIVGVPAARAAECVSNIPAEVRHCEWLGAEAALPPNEPVMCTIGTMAPFKAKRHNCLMLTIEGDAMHDMQANAPPDYPRNYILNACVSGLRANLPGYESDYIYTCQQIMAATQR